MNRNLKTTLLFVLLLCLGTTVRAQDNVVDEVVWIVGDEAIMKSEVEEARLSALYQGRRFEADAYCVLPEEIAVQKLFLHQAELDSIEVPESQVIQEVDFQTNQYIANIGSREKMEEYFNKTSSQIRETRIYVMDSGCRKCKGNWSKISKSLLLRYAATSRIFHLTAFLTCPLK